MFFPMVPMSAPPSFTALAQAVNQPKIGFDSQNPPPQAVLDSCVHCGFCLNTCPSYRVIGKETDSPRGRIYLMNGINQGQASLDATTIQHFDSCLGCLACVSACPSGVQYDQLISATRPQVERNHDRPFGDRLLRGIIFNLFPYPWRLRLLLPLLWVYQNCGLQKLVQATGLLSRFFPRLAAMESILPRVTAASFRDNYPTEISAQGEKRYRVGIILGCVQRLFFSPVNEATVRVLTANGCEVVIPQSQGCCAALPAHQGQTDQAEAIARQMIDSFANTEVDYIIINAAGCGHTLKEYHHILADDAEYLPKAQAFVSKVRDINEFLMEIGLNQTLHPVTEELTPVVYQDACHLIHGQKISLQPRQLIAQIPHLQLREPLDAALCCGSAGVYNMLQPAVAEELGQQKVNNLCQTGAQLIISANPGCSLQIQKHLGKQGQNLGVIHPIQLLDLSLRGEKLTGL
ncbi:glycolate oxidase subunit (Fe-S) protein [Synechocystis sp. PCC 6803]|uniref:Glycolate oxidase iron-sulfur subunit n=1 Tax=Synechocystis sp. (strain ATCC 27184 / PCC 6803 / Kazusa) TaxID=1111708 RepID=P73119_SYNY3|nr:MULTISPECIES: (Fe-S)-binding protein [unclassified Synechocystis]BAM50863.1 glycolate oxidase subunit (Fe-S) protein [Synechocystis sp. PCC 6803] [Bacillus subtilis BEST7613]AGF50835.1 glycolate oxidase subunit (Fe-S) protein [Synechocystis sp. PCC 6803]AVP88729.1 (Fe-S)-binding protein [Synechocystis sp. IPPAS B-1465]MCW5239965.1 (Fe-S)-binding protein [Synechocystis sp. PCC 6803]NHL97745.1 4Fe-4S dicluster domain-containing protein [Synechocystis sp. PCC 6803]